MHNTVDGTDLWVLVRKVSGLISVVGLEAPQTCYIPNLLTAGRCVPHFETCWDASYWATVLFSSRTHAQNIYICVYVCITRLRDLPIRKLTLCILVDSYKISRNNYISRRAAVARLLEPSVVLFTADAMAVEKSVRRSWKGAKHNTPFICTTLFYLPSCDVYGMCHLSDLIWRYAVRILTWPFTKAQLVAISSHLTPKDTWFCLVEEPVNTYIHSSCERKEPVQ
jgi:hypothetical protein